MPKVRHGRSGVLILVVAVLAGVATAAILVYNNLNIEQQKSFLNILKFASILVGSASGLIGASVETKDKDGYPNPFGRWVIAIIVVSMTVGVTTQAAENAIKRHEDKLAANKADREEADKKIQMETLEQLIASARETKRGLEATERGLEGTKKGLVDAKVGLDGIRTRADRSLSSIQASARDLGQLRREASKTTRNVVQQGRLLDESQRSLLDLETDQRLLIGHEMEVNRQDMRVQFMAHPVDAYINVTYPLDAPIFADYVARVNRRRWEMVYPQRAGLTSEEASVFPNPRNGNERNAHRLLFGESLRFGFLKDVAGYGQSLPVRDLSVSARDMYKPGDLPFMFRAPASPYLIDEVQPRSKVVVIADKDRNEFSVTYVVSGAVPYYDPLGSSSTFDILDSSLFVMWQTNAEAPPSTTVHGIKLTFAAGSSPAKPISFEGAPRREPPAPAGVFYARKVSPEELGLGHIRELRTSMSQVRRGLERKRP